MLSRAVCGHQFALAPLPLCRTHESRCAVFRPQATGRSQQKLRCGVAKDADELQLVKREGAILCMPIDLHGFSILALHLGNMSYAGL